MFQRIYAVYLKCLFSLGLLVLVGLPALGQSASSAAVKGVVQDTSDASIPNAQVKLINTDTGTESRTTTNNSGSFVVPSVIPGHYTLQIERDGFATTQLTGITLNVGDNKDVLVHLKVGSTSESIHVDGSGLNINTSDGSVSTVVDRHFVENMPLNGRSFQSLISLTPGVTTVTPAAGNGGGQFSINGQRGSANNFTVDGVSANFSASPGAVAGTGPGGNLPGLTVAGTTQSLASVDAMQEFRVETSTYSAEYGRQPGGQVSIVTRSGTNQFHGSLFNYLRNDVFDANNWFADQTGQPKAATRQNDFGGTNGGPVVLPGLYDGRNRTFYFFSYEGLRLRQPQFALTNVPSLVLRQTAPAAMQPILNAFPVPNGKILSNGLAELDSSYSNPSNLDATSLRIDHTLNNKVTLFGRYNLVPSELISRLASSLSNVQTNKLNIQSITLGANITLTPSAINEIRANYTGNGAYRALSVDNFSGAAQPPANGIFVPTQYESNNSSGSVTLQFTGATSASYPSITALPNSVESQRLFNITDSVSFMTGRQHFKFGVDYLRAAPNSSSTSYSISSTFLSQTSTVASRADTAYITAGITLKPVFTSFSTYAQDSWRVSNRLTLDLGLRWELSPPPADSAGHVYLAVTQITNLASMQLAPIGTPRWKTTYSNFAPRFSLAYQLSQAEGHETVLRGGFGIFYDTGNDAASRVNFWPYTANTTISHVAYPLSSSQAAAPALPAAAALSTPYGGPFTVIDPNLKLPYTAEWNVALEQSLGKSQALTLSYVGSSGRRMIQLQSLSLASINPSFTSISLATNLALSNYDSFQVQYQRRLTRGLQALVSYTLSHALDNDSSSSSNRTAVYGNAAFDARNVLAGAATYDIPVFNRGGALKTILSNWALDTSVHTQSALPVDLVAKTYTDPTDGSLVNVRPNVNPGVPFYLSGSACAASNGGVPCPGGRRINAAAFSTNVPTGQSGNFGRNQVRGLELWQVDNAVMREFPLHEALKLQFRAEAFNIFNHPNFGQIQTTLTASNFGEPTNMLNQQLGTSGQQLYQPGGPRSFQFALKVLF